MLYMNIRNKYQITEYCHQLLEHHICQGDCCIDATCGRGHDTEFLCQRVGSGGKVYAFDIQKCAIEQTKQRLEQAGCAERAVLICDSHENMKIYVMDAVSVIMFNFGYLPGGSHTISTKAESSISAVEQGLDLLKPGGIMSLCIYSGGDTGYEEKNGLLDYLRCLDPKRYLVITHNFFNRENDPPLPVSVIKLL